MSDTDDQRRECPELFFSANNRRSVPSAAVCYLRASIPVFASPAGIRASTVRVQGRAAA